MIETLLIFPSEMCLCSGTIISEMCTSVPSNFYVIHFERVKYFVILSVLVQFIKLQTPLPLWKFVLIIPFSRIKSKPGFSVTLDCSNQYQSSVHSKLCHELELAVKRDVNHKFTLAMSWIKPITTDVRVITFQTC